MIKTMGINQFVEKFTFTANCIENTNRPGKYSPRPICAQGEVPAKCTLKS